MVRAGLADDVFDKGNIVACPDAGEDENQRQSHVIKFHVSTLQDSQRKGGRAPQMRARISYVRLSCLMGF